MSASIIWPIAPDHRRTFRLRGIGALRLLPAMALLLSAAVSSAVEELGKPFLEKNSFFTCRRPVFASSSPTIPPVKKRCARCRRTASLQNGAGDAVRYLYAEPQHCVCIFVGTQQAATATAISSASR